MLLVDFSESRLEMSGTCGRRMLAFHFSDNFVLSFQFAPSYPPHSSFSSYPLLYSFPSYPFLEFRRQGAAAGPDAASKAGGRPPRPGPRWVPEAATPEAG